MGGRYFKYRPLSGPVVAVRSYMYGHRSPSDFAKIAKTLSAFLLTAVLLDSVLSSEPPPPITGAMAGAILGVRCSGFCGVPASDDGERLRKDDESATSSLRPRR